MDSGFCLYCDNDYFSRCDNCGIMACSGCLDECDYHHGYVCKQCRNRLCSFCDGDRLLKRCNNCGILTCYVCSFVEESGDYSCKICLDKKESDERIDRLYKLLEELQNKVNDLEQTYKI